jgi:glutamyl-tRNA synthetase
MTWQSGDMATSVPPTIGRFAPTPSGPLHLGNLRTALLAWTAATADGGVMVLRVEDLDPATARPEHEAGQLADLSAIGLRWPQPVMHQGDRVAAHRAAVDRLRALGLVYPCFCTRREIQAAAQAPNAPLGGGYPGTCAALDEREVRTRLAAVDRQPAWRVRAGGTVASFDDLVHGLQQGVSDDFVVQRNDGVVAYHVAVVVDDAAQGVTQVVRGDDLLDSTPRQRWLQDVLGLPVPQYAHVPLVLGPDGTRLAKRHGAVTLADLAARGLDARRVLAHLGSSLGWCRPDDRRPIPDLLAAFVAGWSFERLPRAPWVLAQSLA